MGCDSNMTDEITVTKDEIDSIIGGEIVHVDGYELKTGDPRNAGDAVIQTYDSSWKLLKQYDHVTLTWKADVPDVVPQEPRWKFIVAVALIWTIMFMCVLIYKKRLLNGKWTRGWRTIYE